MNQIVTYQTLTTANQTMRGTVQIQGGEKLRSLEEMIKYVDIDLSNHDLKRKANTVVVILFYACLPTREMISEVLRDEITGALQISHIGSF